MADSQNAEPGTLLVVLRGIGAAMFLTDHHLVVARDGAQRRPRTGFQILAFDEIRHMRIELGTAPSGRIVIWTTGGQEALSMFFDARSLDRARELLHVARPLIARSRRRSGAADPRHSPIQRGGRRVPSPTRPPGRAADDRQRRG